MIECDEEFESIVNSYRFKTVIKENICKRRFESIVNSYRFKTLTTSVLNTV